MEKTLVSVVGPTGIGKTGMAIAIAVHFGTEIVSADSRQFYKEMSIGTAVPSKDELATVPHHFIQHMRVVDDYSVGDYERDALLHLERLFAQKEVVVLVGGSGLYTDSVTKGLDHFPEIDPKIRVRLNETLTEGGLRPLQKQLSRLDPRHYKKIDLENPHRVIRALEVCLGTGQPYSSFLGKDRPKRFFKTLSLGIMADRELVYRRIDQRVDLMMEQGLLDEARPLHSQKHLNALQTVGYRELFRYFDGEYDLDFAIAEIKKNTRRFAKRQLTWYRKQPDILWVPHDLPIEHVLDRVQERLNTVGNG